jgi:hypothetical protein
MAAAVNEAIVADVMKLLASYGELVRWVHARDSRYLHGTKGFPDFLITGRGGVLFRECKPRRSSQLFPSQTAWRYLLKAAGADYGIWTQEDLDDGTIEREVDAII